jgi:UDP-N-acetylmuramoyl-tripeptide--D-alanyl-D-alanine ligase
MGGQAVGRSGGRVWTSAEVAKALGTLAPVAASFNGISTDTRHLTAGTLFVALTGDRFDAHVFLADARAKGAAAAVVRRGTPPVDRLPFFEVDDTLEALGLLARARRRLLPARSPVVAVTGSSGKTSTKEMIRAALATRWRVHATSENLNNLVGVPLTILGAPEDADALVVEAGASVPGEIAKLRTIIEPTIAVVTNVGYAHLEGFGSLDGVMREKLAITDGVPLAVVGTDPPALAAEARRQTRTLVAGSDPAADVHPESAELDDEGHPRIRWAGHEATLAVVGFHQIENAMIALAVAREAGADPGLALAALAGVRLPPGRGSVLEVGGLTVIDDTYNANPASLRWAVRFAHWLAARRGRPLAVVVGSMLELGPESARLHAAAAREIAALRPALIGAVGEFVTAFAELEPELRGRLLTAPDAEALGPRLRAALRGNEIVLLKASRGAALERVLRHLN